MNFDLKTEVKRMGLGLISALIMAVNIKTLVRAGGLYPGGFNGITLLIQTICERFLNLQIPFTAVSLSLNAIPVIICFRAIGKKFTSTSALIVIVTSVLTDLVPYHPITDDILLISVFGGIINGFAISLCLIGGASAGGTDFIGIYFAEKKNKDVWNFILLGNACVLTIAGVLFGWDKALYSIIFQFASTQMIHMLHTAYKKETLFIVTDRPDDVYKEIQQLIVSERKKQKVTQKELAHRTGLSQANISNIENGVTRPTIDSLQKIAEALGKRLLVCFEESEDI